MYVLLQVTDFCLALCMHEHMHTSDSAFLREAGVGIDGSVE